MASSNSIERKVQQESDRYCTSGIYQTSTFVDHFDYHVKKLMQDQHPQHHFPAVDLMAKHGVLTCQLALRYRAPAFPATLDFHPIDSKPDRTKAGLKHMKEVAAKEEALFNDPNGVPVFEGDFVFLRGLSNKKFNEREGKVMAKDEKQEGRIGIKLLNATRGFESGMLSIKEENLYIPGDDLERHVYRRVMSKDEQQDFYQGLHDRVLSWVGVTEIIQKYSHLQGKCALVTCLDAKSSFARSEQHRWWLDSIATASFLLMEGGCLLILGDYAGMDRNDGYGNIMGMENLVHSHGLNMALQSYNDQFFKPPDWPAEKVVMLWTKVDSQYSQMAQMQAMQASGDMAAMFREMSWHPSVPKS